MKFSLQNRLEKEMTFQAREYQIDRVGWIRYLGLSFSNSLSCLFHIDTNVKKSSEASS